MSKLKESLQLYWKGVKNFDKVYEGFLTEVKLKSGNLPTEEVEEITNRRLVCASCPFNSNNAKQLIDYQELVGVPYITTREELHCSFCSCGIELKSACLTCNCGIETWNKNNPDKQIPLKWESFKKPE